MIAAHNGNNPNIYYLPTVPSRDREWDKATRHVEEKNAPFCTCLDRGDEIKVNRKGSVFLTTHTNDKTK
jgi:hypothetical protein